MDCKFLSNGVSINNKGILRPCCWWRIDPEWEEQNHIAQFEDISSWRKKAKLDQELEALQNGTWPERCIRCKQVEQSADYSSMRMNGNSAYGHYAKDDITLEIKPGNVCNFACQTCWPTASTRVAKFLHDAKLLDKKTVSTNRISDFSILNPIAKNIKNVVLLGGEPFYDKNCRKFLSWAKDNLDAECTIFTNGSIIDFDFIDQYKGKLTLVFSIDAIGKPIEYIRFGSDWETIKKNYEKCKKIEHIAVRVNITSSIYNVFYLPDLVEFLLEDWPDLVTIDKAKEEEFGLNVIPKVNRKPVIDKLSTILDLMHDDINIQNHQKTNIINFVNHLIDALTNEEYNSTAHIQLLKFVKAMDKVKNIRAEDYCSEFLDLIRE